MTRRRVEDVLGAAGRAPVPPPRPELVDAIEARLTSTHAAHAPSVRARRVPAITLAAALVAAVVALGFVVRRDDGTNVRTERPATSAPPTTAPSTTTTLRELDASSATTIPVGTTTSTTATHAPPVTIAGPGPTTTTPHEPTTTTTPHESTTTTTTEPTSTTTTTAAPAHLALTCTTSTSPSAMVTCTWTESTDARFDHYRLWKHTADGPSYDVYVGTAREAHDSDVQAGAQLIYEVTAVAADGTVLAHGDNRITCC